MERSNGVGPTFPSPPAATRVRTPTEGHCRRARGWRSSAQLDRTETESDILGAILPRTRPMNHRDGQAAAGQLPLASDDANDAAALCAAGFRHFEAARALDAQLCCRQALSLDPHHADTMHLLGLLSLQAAQHELALEWLSRAIREVPKPQYLSSLGKLLLLQGRHEDALKAFDKAVQLDPAAPQSWR